VSPNGNVAYTDSSSLNAFNIALTFARLITIADPWNTLTVLEDTRTIKPIRETRVIMVLEESRVNNTNIETRSYQVPQETKKFKIYKPRFSNRSSIPKVRSEA
jgi:hypothetical protein